MRDSDDALHMALFADMSYTSSQAKPDTITVESMIESVEKIQREWEQERLPRPELRANRKTIYLIGCELARRTPVSRLPADGDLPPIGTPAQLSTLYGMTIEVDESLPDGEVRPLPKPRRYSVMDFFREAGLFRLPAEAMTVDDSSRSLADARLRLCVQRRNDKASPSHKYHARAKRWNQEWNYAHKKEQRLKRLRRRQRRAAQRRHNRGMTR